MTCQSAWQGSCHDAAFNCPRSALTTAAGSPTPAGASWVHLPAAAEQVLHKSRSPEGLLFDAYICYTSTHHGVDCKSASLCSAGCLLLSQTLHDLPVHGSCFIVA